MKTYYDLKEKVLIVFTGKQSKLFTEEQALASLKQGRFILILQHSDGTPLEIAQILDKFRKEMLALRVMEGQIACADSQQIADIFIESCFEASFQI